MSSHGAVRHELQLYSRNALARPGPVPPLRLENLLQVRAHNALFARKPSPTVSLFGTTSCAPDDNSAACQKPVDSTSNTTLPIVLGVVIPLTVALVILLVLHRRHVKKLRLEDANDKHKSLDFGMGEGGSNSAKQKNGRGAQGMSQVHTQDPLRKGRGLSMDLISNPYLLPPTLQQSRESLHSLTRSLHNDDDKYRPAIFPPNDGSRSYPSSIRSPVDDSSSFTGSSRRRFETDSNRNTIKHPNRVSSAGVPKPGSIQSVSVSPAQADQQNPQPPRKDSVPSQNNNLMVPESNQSTRESYQSANSTRLNAAIRASNDYLGAFIRGGAPKPGDHDKSKTNDTSMVVTETTFPSRTPEHEPKLPPAVVLKPEEAHRHAAIDPPAVASLEPTSQHQVRPQGQQAHETGSPLDREPRLPQLSFMESGDFQQDFKMPDIEFDKVQPEEKRSSATPMAGVNNQVRPHRASTLPDLSLSQSYDPSQHRESQYDFYDEEEENMGYNHRELYAGARPLPPDDPTESEEQRASRIRSFYKEYFDEKKTPNDQQQQMVNYFDGSEHYGEEDYYDEPDYYQMPPARGPRPYAGSERHRPTYSTGSFMSSPRAMSTASGQWGSQPRRPPVKKKLPPPKPLHNLPTPHLLKDDSALSLDYAPPSAFRDQRAGTPDSSLRGGLRPYSPARPARNPLASSYDDLSVMPSP